MIGMKMSNTSIYHAKKLFVPLYMKMKTLLSNSTFSKSNAIQMSYNKYEFSSANGNPPVVIMHGLFGSKNNWNSMSKALQKHLKRNIISVDARNHGDSAHTNVFSYNHLVADLKCLFEDLRLSSAITIGHSMGGRAMMLFALNYPEKVEKLIVVDISPFQSSRKIYDMKYYFEALKSINLSQNLSMSEARQQANQQLGQWIKDYDVRQFLLTNLVKNACGNFGWKINLDALSANFDGEIVQFPLGSNLVCPKPTLFIGGTKSDYLRPSDESNILKLFPAATFVYLDCGHWVHAEKPHEFISITSDFVNSH